MVFKDCVREIPYDYECLCRCHRTGQTHKECCIICPHCQRNVKHSKFEVHEKACKKACRVEVKTKPLIEIKPASEEIPETDFNWIVKLLECNKCHRRILIEDALRGVSHIVSTSITCWNCLTKKTQIELKKDFNLKP
ncbi:MAG: hypothetical protein Q8L47_00570 [bacterium]|nr:hypothetical protein [bacterium]